MDKGVQDVQYASVLYFHGYTGFTYFLKYDRVLKMRRNTIMEAWLQMQTLHKVLNMPEYGWMMPE